MFKLPASTHIENVHLRVRSLEQSLKFYSELLGFKEVQRRGNTVFLSASDEQSALVVLTEQPDASPRTRRAPGLFHTAILYPSRKELASIFKRLYELSYPFQGFADHGVSEALYLADMEGNGIELYADRPRDRWQYKNGELAMVTEELDLENLLAEVESESSWAGAHPETRIGHVHLQVSDIPKAEQFYHGLLGFDVTQKSYPGALFVSAGGYHHHLGMNIWNSRGSAPASPNALGLASFRIQVGDRNALETVNQRVEQAGMKSETKNECTRVVDNDGIAVELVNSN